jgi:AcrR family transcriptional regulator
VSATDPAACDPGPTRRRRLEPDARRQQILSCAVRLFGERPYDEVSATDVAREAGVARGLVNHYFGTKKELYLEVVRVLVTIPDVVLDTVPQGDLATRVDAAVTWFLGAVSRHAEPWLAAIGATAPSHNPEVAEVIAQADEVTVDHILTLAGVKADQAGEQLRAATRAYVAFARAGAVQWLVRGSLSRHQAHVLLSGTLVAVLADVAPRLDEVAAPVSVTPRRHPRRAP